jgi:hypothetical protein
MWLSLKKFAYRKLYDWGKTPPSSAEIAATLERLEANPPPGPREIAPGPAARCDCQVLAGSTMVDCRANIATFACELIGDSMPGMRGVPLPLGSCGNLPRSP